MSRLQSIVEQILKSENYEEPVEKVEYDGSMSSVEVFQLKREKAGTLQKAFLTSVIDSETFQKAMMNLSHLIPMKVQIKGKDGKMYQAIRWVNPNTGESEKLNTKIKEKNIVTATASELEKSILKVMDSDMPLSEKFRNYINMGLYDKKILMILTGKGLGDVNYYLEKDSEVDVNSLDSSKVEEVKGIIREQQKNIDTPEGREAATMLREIPLDEIWENYEDDLQMVIDNQHKFALAMGTGGVGKTYTFTQLAKKNELREFDSEVQPSKDQYDYIVIGGKITPSQVYAEMYRHRDKLIVFDDCDSFLVHPDVQGFLKNGLDTGERNTIKNLTGATVYNIQGDKESGKIPDTFRFKGRMIAITNLRIDQIDQAVRSRAAISDLTMTVDETMDKLELIKDKIVLYTADKTAEIDVPQEFRDLAFDVLKENKYRIGAGINTRMFSTAFLQAMIASKSEKGHDPARIRRKILASYLNSIDTEKIEQSKKR